jgi:hypothetical protein
MPCAPSLTSCGGCVAKQKPIEKVAIDSLVRAFHTKWLKGMRNENRAVEDLVELCFQAMRRGRQDMVDFASKAAEVELDRATLEVKDNPAAVALAFAALAAK